VTRLIFLALAVAGLAVSCSHEAKSPAAGGAAALDAAAPDAARAPAPSAWRVYIGTYTQRGSEGIYALRLDLASGSLTPEGLAAKAENPSFLAIHPSGRFLYAVGELGDFAGQRSGAVSAFSIDPSSGRLALLNQKPSHGAGPCHLVVDRAGRHVLVANYGGGSIACLRIEADGRLGDTAAAVQHHGSSVNPRRQEAPHAHSINLDAANRFAVAADLGLDKLLVYRFDAATGALTPNDPPAAAAPPGAGPRHFAFHRGGRRAYAIHEMASTLGVYDYDPERGVLAEVQTVSTLPAGFAGSNSTAEVQVAPSGSFVYGSNRGHDSIAVFAVEGERGTLRLVEHEPSGGKTPRNFGIDPSGKFLLAANQGSDSVVVFKIDPQSGALEPTGHAAAVASPVCVKFAVVGD
jgi:6-phosphogluconolactonase